MRGGTPSNYLNFMKKEDNSVTFYQNPKIDCLIILVDGPPIPTKQDKFVPVDVVEILEDGSEQVLKDFYVKKPDRDAVTEFNRLIKKSAESAFPGDTKIKKPNEVEIIISVSVTERRFKEVDVDNLAKCVLDSLNNFAFEDDSQITSLICSKHVHPMKKNGIMIGITKLTSTNKGFGNDIKLLSDKPW